MAVIYLSSVDGSDSDDGSTWALAKATLLAAVTAAGDGGTVYVDNAHAETQASNMALASPGTAATPVRILCVDRTGNPEPPTTLATTGTVSTTGNTAISFTGFATVYGLTFTAGSGNSGNARLDFISGAPWFWRFASCKLKIGSTTGGSGTKFNCGVSSTASDDQRLELINTVVEFGHASQNFVIRCPFLWHGGSLAGTAPTSLFINPPTGNSAWAVVRGVDLSLTANTILDNSGGNYGAYYLYGCKLNASATVVAGAPAGQGGTTITLTNCDSGDTITRYFDRQYAGTVASETTIVRTGGASDGTTGFSRKMVSGANARFEVPVATEWVTFWNETTGSVTVTFETVTDNVTLTDADAWAEVEYMGTSGFPLVLYANDRAASPLATPANQTSSSETWTTTGLTTPVKQKLSVTFTTAERGWVRARVCLAKASTTVYVCPKIMATSYKQTMLPDGVILNHVAVPAEEDVEDGVTYGADGTEFEGTLEAGGGSGGIQRPVSMTGGLV